MQGRGFEPPNSLRDGISLSKRKGDLLGKPWFPYDLSPARLTTSLSLHAKQRSGTPLCPENHNTFGI